MISLGGLLVVLSGALGRGCRCWYGCVWVCGGGCRCFEEGPTVDARVNRSWIARLARSR